MSASHPDEHEPTEPSTSATAPLGQENPAEASDSTARNSSTSASPSSPSAEAVSPGGATADAAPATANAKLDKKKTIIGAIITIVVLVLVFSGLASRFGSFSDAWDKIQQMSTLALISLALVAIINILVYTFPYQVAIPGLKYKPAFMVRQTSWMMAALVPAGGAFALALQYMMLASYRVSPAMATSGIAITSVWSFFMTFLLPVLGVLAVSTSGQLESAWVWAGVIGLAALVVMVIVFWLILRSEASAKKVGELGQKLAGPILRKLKKDVDITDSILSFRVEVVDVVKARWLALTLTNLLVSFMQFMILYVAIVGVSGPAGSEVSFAEAFAAFAISRLGTLIPLTPGGLGTVAGVLGAMLAVFGLSQENILAAVLVWQMVQLFPQATVGIFTLLGWRVQEARRTKVAA